MVRFLTVKAPGSSDGAGTLILKQAENRAVICAGSPPWNASRCHLSPRETPGNFLRWRSRCCGPSGRGVFRRWAARALHVATDEVAERAPEIFVPRIRHERARIRDHADEAREQAEIRQGIHLPFHAFFLVQKPPAGAELDFSRNRAVLEIPDHRGKGVIVRRIKVVDDGFRERIFLVEPVQITGERGTFAANRRWNRNPCPGRVV